MHWTLLLIALVVGSSRPASASKIDNPFISGLVSLLPDFAAVGGASTDGANFKDSELPNAFGKAVGTAGTFSFASAVAIPAMGTQPTYVSTEVFTSAGRGQFSSAFAISKADSLISVSAHVQAVNGLIDFQIDPYLS
jgi:hypothetical protein